MATLRSAVAVLSLDEGLGLFVRVVRRAVLEFTLGFVPEFIIPALGFAGKLPQLVGTRSDLVIGRTGHIWARCFKRMQGHTGVTPYGHAGDCPSPEFRLQSHNSRPDIFVPIHAYFALQWVQDLVTHGPRHHDPNPDPRIAIAF